MGTVQYLSTGPGTAQYPTVPTHFGYCTVFQGTAQNLPTVPVLHSTLQYLHISGTAQFPWVLHSTHLQFRYCTVPCSTYTFRVLHSFYRYCTVPICSTRTAQYPAVPTHFGYCTVHPGTAQYPYAVPVLHSTLQFSPDFGYCTVPPGTAHSTLQYPWVLQTAQYPWVLYSTRQGSQIQRPG